VAVHPNSAVVDGLRAEHRFRRLRAPRAEQTGQPDHLTGVQVETHVGQQRPVG
jgi:hypothetical protein